MKQKMHLTIRSLTTSFRGEVWFEWKNTYQVVHSKTHLISSSKTIIDEQLILQSNALQTQFSIFGILSQSFLLLTTDWSNSYSQKSFKINATTTLSYLVKKSSSAHSNQRFISINKMHELKEMKPKQRSNFNTSRKVQRTPPNNDSQLTFLIEGRGRVLSAQRDLQNQHQYYVEQLEKYVLRLREYYQGKVQIQKNTYVAQITLLLDQVQEEEKTKFTTIESLITNISQLEIVIQTLHLSNNELNNKLNLLKSQYTSLQQNRNALQSKNNQLQNTIKEQTTNFQQQSLHLSSTIQSKQLQLLQLKSKYTLQLQGLQSILNATKQQYAIILQRQRGAHSKQLQQLRSQHQQSLQQLQFTSQVISNLNNQIAQLSMQNTTWSSKYSSLSAQHSTTSTQLSTVQNQLQRVSSQASKLEGQKAQLTKKVGQMLNDYEMQTVEFNSREGEFIEKRQRLEERIRELEGRIREMEERMGETQERMGEMQQSMRDMEEQSAHWQQVIQALAKESLAIKAENQSLKAMQSVGEEQKCDKIEEKGISTEIQIGNLFKQTFTYVKSQENKDKKVENFLMVNQPDVDTRSVAVNNEDRIGPFYEEEEQKRARSSHGGEEIVNNKSKSKDVIIETHKSVSSGDSIGNEKSKIQQREKGSSRDNAVLQNSFSRKGSTSKISVTSKNARKNSYNEVNGSGEKKSQKLQKQHSMEEKQFKTSLLLRSKLSQKASNKEGQKKKKINIQEQPVFQEDNIEEQTEKEDTSLPLIEENFIPVKLKLKAAKGPAFRKSTTFGYSSKLSQGSFDSNLQSVKQQSKVNVNTYFQEILQSKTQMKGSKQSFGLSNKNKSAFNNIASSKSIKIGISDDRNRKQSLSVDSYSKQQTSSQKILAIKQKLSLIQEKQKLLSQIQSYKQNIMQMQTLNKIYVDQNKRYNQRIGQYIKQKQQQRSVRQSLQQQKREYLQKCEQHNFQIECMNKQVTQQILYNNELIHLNEKHKEELREQQKNIQLYNEEIYDLSDNLREVKENLSRMNEENSELQSQVSFLNEQIELHIQENQERIGAAEEKIRNITLELSQKEGKLISLNQTLLHKQSNIKKLETEKTENYKLHQEKVGRMNIKIIQYEGKIQQYQYKIKDLATYVQNLEQNLEKIKKQHQIEVGEKQKLFKEKQKIKITTSEFIADLQSKIIVKEQQLQKETNKNNVLHFQHKRISASLDELLQKSVIENKKYQKLAQEYSQLQRDCSGYKIKIDGYQFSQMKRNQYNNQLQKQKNQWKMQQQSLLNKQMLQLQSDLQKSQFDNSVLQQKFNKIQSHRNKLKNQLQQTQHQNQLTANNLMEEKNNLKHKNDKLTVEFQKLLRRNKQLQQIQQKHSIIQTQHLNLKKQFTQQKQESQRLNGRYEKSMEKSSLSYNLERDLQKAKKQLKQYFRANEQLQFNNANQHKMVTSLKSSLEEIENKYKQLYLHSAQTNKNYMKLEKQYKEMQKNHKILIEENTLQINNLSTQFKNKIQTANNQYQILNKQFIKIKSDNFKINQQNSDITQNNNKINRQNQKYKRIIEEKQQIIKEKEKNNLQYQKKLFLQSERIVKLEQQILSLMKENSEVKNQFSQQKMKQSVLLEINKEKYNERQKQQELQKDIEFCKEEKRKYVQMQKSKNQEIQKLQKKILLIEQSILQKEQENFNLSQKFKRQFSIEKLKSQKYQSSLINIKEQLQQKILRINQYKQNQQKERAIKKELIQQYELKVSTMQYQIDQNQRLKQQCNELILQIESKHKKQLQQLVNSKNKINEAAENQRNLQLSQYKKYAEEIKANANNRIIMIRTQLGNQLKAAQNQYKFLSQQCDKLQQQLQMYRNIHYQQKKNQRNHYSFNKEQVRSQFSHSRNPKRNINQSQIRPILKTNRKDVNEQKKMMNSLKFDRRQSRLQKQTTSLYKDVLIQNATSQDEQEQYSEQSIAQNGKIGRLLNEIKSKQRKAQKLNKKLLQHQIQRQKQITQIADLNVKVNLLNQNINVLQKQKRIKQQNSNKKASQHTTYLRMQLQHLKQNHKQLIKNYQSLKDKNAGLQLQKSKHEFVLLQLKQQLTNSNQSRRQCEQKCKQCVFSLSTQIQTYKGQNKELQQQLLSLQNKSNTNVQKLQTVINEKHTLIEEKKSLLAELHQVASLYENAFKRLEEIMVLVKKAGYPTFQQYWGHRNCGESHKQNQLLQKEVERLKLIIEEESNFAQNQQSRDKIAQIKQNIFKIEAVRIVIKNCQAMNKREIISKIQNIIDKEQII